jgi:hypothetical protein
VQPLKEKGNLKASGVPDWAATYIDVEWPVVFDVIKAADFLNVGLLANLCAAKIASRIQRASRDRLSLLTV